MNGPRDLENPRPTSWTSVWIHDRRLKMNVGRNHAFAEGAPVDDDAVLRGYHRARLSWIERQTTRVVDRLSQMRTP
jgi:hypothetical protein